MALAVTSNSFKDGDYLPKADVDAARLQDHARW